MPAGRPARVRVPEPVRGRHAPHSAILGFRARPPGTIVDMANKPKATPAAVPEMRREPRGRTAAAAVAADPARNLFFPGISP
jgi:hypothetical protein